MQSQEPPIPASFIILLNFQIQLEPEVTNTAPTAEDSDSRGEEEKEVEGATLTDAEEEEAFLSEIFLMASSSKKLSSSALRPQSSNSSISPPLHENPLAVDFGSEIW
ncbi:hypothetical protein BHM03_00010755 [Ensete ventricosum]|nr:hypothetical protein BHM03_00010755 [Ensete ventricosum]